MTQVIQNKHNLLSIGSTSIFNTVNHLANSQAFESWASYDNQSEYYFYSLQALKLLTKELTLTSFEYELGAMLMEENSLVLTRNGSTSKKHYIEKETSLSSVQFNEIMSYFKVNQHPMVIPTYKKDLLNEIYYIIKKSYLNQDVICIVKIPVTTLFGYNNSDEFIIYDSQKVIAKQSMTVNFETKYPEILKSLQENMNSEQNNFDLSNQKVFFSSKNIYGLGLNIAYIYDTPAVTTYGIIIFILLSSLLLLALALLLSKYIVKKLYSPLSEVMSNISLGDNNATIDEFRILKENTENINSLTLKLEDALQTNETLISQRFYRDAIMGSNISNSSYENIIIQNEDSPFCVILIDFQHIANSETSNTLFLYKNHILSDAQKEDKFKYVNINYFSSALVMYTDSVEFAKQSILQLINNIESDIQPKIAISNIAVGTNNIHSCFEQAVKILEYKYLYGNNNLITTISQVEQLDGKNYYYPLSVENKLIHNMVNGSNQSENIYRELIKENIENRNLTPGSLKNFIYSLTSTLSRAIQELKLDYSDVFEDNIDIDFLHNNWNNANVISLIGNAINKITTIVINRNTNIDDELLSKMLNYIYENYSDNIMLNDMADKFNISSKYCSLLFKKLSDDTFKNFLNSYRMKKAKELIAETPNIKINDLSAIVGFNSANSFIRVFNKYVGMSPKQYADSINRDDF